MRGRGLRKVLIVGETEASLKHFMLRRLLNRAGLPEDYFFFAHLYEPLNELIKANGIRAVVALGEKSLRQLVGESDIERWRGRVVPHPMGIWTIPTFSPAKLMNYRGNTESVDSEIMRHPPRFHGVWIRDIHEALKVAKNGFERRPGNYLLDPTPEEFASYADSYFQSLGRGESSTSESAPWLSWDIETVYKRPGDDEEELDAELLNGTILRISFSFEPYTGVSVPWAPAYLPTIARLLASPGRMVVWNGSTFDVPVVQKNGFQVKGIVYDFMDLFHLYQSDLPKGLEWVSSFYTDLLPWKHLANASPVLYSAIDADAALRNALGIIADLKSLNQWDLAEKHVVKLMPLLADAGERGNLIDLEKRTEIRTRLLAMKQELIDEAQTFVPRELKPRHLFKNQPDDVAGTFATSREPVEGIDLDGWDIRWEAEDAKFCSACGLPASNKTEHFKGSKEEHPDKPGKLRQVKNPCKLAGGEIVKLPAYVPRFYRIDNFNANSSDQLIAYMKFNNHPVGADKKDKEKETADAKHIKKLIRDYGAKFPLYSNALKLHQAIKTIGTYTPEPDANSILHTQYVNSPSTWRLGSRKVQFGTQIQNWSKREDNPYAKPARKQIIARPNRKLVQVDSSAVEAVFQGYFMNDPKYMELASQSIHAWMVTKHLGWAFNEDTVTKVKKEHERLYLQMKTSTYAINFGGTAHTLLTNNPELYPTRKVAQDAVDLVYNLLPTLKTFHHAERWAAHKKTYLESPWGYRHHYYDVFKPTPDGKLELGRDATRCTAFRPQNSNASFQRDNLLLLGYSPIEGEPYTEIPKLLADWEILERAYKAGETWGQFMPTNASVHDSACLDCPNELVEKAADVQMAIFSRPIPEMKGLRIGCEVEAGANWAGAGKDNPSGMDRIAKVVIDNYDYSTTEAGMPLAQAA